MNSSATRVQIPRTSTSPTFHHCETFEEYAEAYFVAAKTLWEAIPKLECRVPRPDHVILPVLFLLYHFIELELKQVILLSASVGTLSGRPVADVPDTTHDLRQLLDVAESNLAALDLGNQSFLTEQQLNLIEDLQSFCAYGVPPRYPTHTKKQGGHPTLPRTFVVDIPAVMDVVSEIRIQMGGPVGMLTEMKQVILTENLVSHL